MINFLFGIIIGMMIWDYWCERDHWYREDIDEIVEEEDRELRRNWKS